MATDEERKDAIDRFVEGAIRIFPTLDPEVEAAVDRMHKITKYLDRTTERTVKVFGLNTGEFKVLLKKAGLQNQEFTFHSLRHTFATELFRRGKHPKIVQSLLGHSSITQTMDRYSHLLEGIGGDAVEDLDESFG